MSLVSNAMNNHTKFCALVIFLLLIYALLNQGEAKMVITSIVNCEEIDYVLSYNITTYFEGDRQFMDANATFKIPLSDDLKSNFRTELALGTKKIHILSITERRACNVLQKYLGEFLHDLERAAGLIPGMCPIQKGKYRVNHHFIDLDKMTIRGFPLGILHFRLAIMDESDVVASCLKGMINHV